MAEQEAPESDDLVTWTLPREEARDLLAWLRRNRPLGMPDSTFDGLVSALVTRPGVSEGGDAIQQWVTHYRVYRPGVSEGGEGRG